MSRKKERGECINCVTPWGLRPRKSSQYNIRRAAAAHCAGYERPAAHCAGYCGAAGLRALARRGCKAPEQSGCGGGGRDDGVVNKNQVSCRPIGHWAGVSVVRGHARQRVKPSLRKLISHICTQICHIYYQSHA
eukprot:scaffold20649_cov113-Isochrysis_galbana.AAC.7